MSLNPNLKELPNSGSHNCFGCSPSNPAGLRMKFFCDGDAVYAPVSVPEHLCGWSNIVHGGVLSTILDETMSWTAIHLLKRIVLTQSMTIEFLKPVRVASALESRGRVRETNGKNDAVLEAAITDAAGEVCARANAHFKVFSPAVARRLKIADEESIRWFEGIFNADA
ncbi:MAG TPA: PaaI family thioesterase [Hyphomicrobium sp.]|nr:PaaI family thioesterase [Hyphomicrobium sp.]